ncbi:MAG: hypothetical protein M5F18_06095 [Asgard group archaeon]|nr:hypothetical protein [Asgard group archaeon]
MCSSNIILVVITSFCTTGLTLSNPFSGTILSFKEQPLTLFKNYKQSWLFEVVSEGFLW